MTTRFPTARRAFFAVSALLLGLAAPVAAQAQDASSSEPTQEQPATSPDAVVATVNGQPITEADLAFAYEDMAQNLANVPPDQIRTVLLAQLIDMRLMAKAGTDAGIESDAMFQARLAYLKERALRRTYTQQQVSDTITEAEIQAEYDRQIAAIPDEDEVRARHILVTTEDDAKAIKAELDAGADFATLAGQKSIEPNAAQSGGDLGYFVAGRMVKPFADAAFALEVGQISEPVQSQFGWHIIKVEDRRKAAKPTIEQLAGQIGQQLYVQKYRTLFESLYGAATIDIPDAALKAAIDAQFAPRQ